MSLEKSGTEEDFGRKLRLLGSGGENSLFLASLWHCDRLAGITETSRSARAVQPVCLG